MMRMAGVIRVLCALLLLGTAAAAQSDYPRLHDVVGVASNDVLNVRGDRGPVFRLSENWHTTPARSR